LRRAREHPFLQDSCRLGRGLLGLGRPGRCDRRDDDGSLFLWSQWANSGYKRLVTTVDLAGKSSGALQFKLSADTEPGFDFVFVEAHTPGQDDWTTLPDQNGNTSPDTGAGCPDDDPFWLILHPFLKHYMTRTGDATNCFSCDPTGTSGAWNAFSGNSGGPKDWNVDLTPYAGKRSSSPSPSRPTRRSTTAPPPSDSPGNANTWTRISSPGFVDGTGIRTDRSIMLGFGVEGITGAAQRNALIRDSLTYLGALP
jgi:hypothetical protein